MSDGYLAQAEASHVTIQPLPGAIVVKLRRAIGAESRQGRKPRMMFVELSITEATALLQNLSGALQTALDLAAASARAGARA